MGPWFINPGEKAALCFREYLGYGSEVRFASVKDVPYVAAGLKVSEWAARTIIETACERGILAKMGNGKRGLSVRLPS